MRTFLKSMAVLLLAAGCSVLPAAAQSSDALLNKLVEKGILTTDEAKQLKTESAKDFNTAYAAKTGMPEWVTQLKFGGDFRGRYDSIIADNDASVNRERWRYRLRFGVVASFKDDLEMGIRLISGDGDSGPSSGFSGLASNQSFQNNASKKGILLDQAYLKWSPLHTEDWKGGMMFGKMEDPFVFGEVAAGMGLGLDPDYTPEGGAFALERKLGEPHTLRWINGAFVLDEISSSSDDPFFFGTQLRLESKWSKRVTTSAGVMWLVFANEDSLNNGGVPNANIGNTRVIPTGTNQASAVPLYGFAPVVADASVTYFFDSAPLYPGRFPIKLVGSVLHNPDAPSAADNEAWCAGVAIGKAGKRGTWEISSCYKWLGANSIWEEVVDDDFGGYWASLAGANTGIANEAPGYYTGTNVRGLITKLSYSPTDSLMLNFKWYLTELIDAPVVAAGVDADSRVNRFQVDAVLKF